MLCVLWGLFDFFCGGVVLELVGWLLGFLFVWGGGVVLGIV